MPEPITIPLVGGLTTRGLNASTALAAGKDQMYTNCIFATQQNPVTEEQIAWVLKRNGFFSSATVLNTYYLNSAYFPYSATGGPIVCGTTSQLGNGNSVIFFKTGGGTYNNCGTTTGIVNDFSEVIFGGTTYFLFTDGAGAGWFLAQDAAVVATPTFTGDTHTNTTIDNVSSLTNLYVGMLLSGTGIQAGTRIASITAPSTITTTLATTATNAGVTITYERIAKIIDANFPTSVIGRFVELDGYVFVLANSTAQLNRIYQSNLNSVTTWSASSYFSANVIADAKSQLFRIGNIIYAQGPQSLEAHYNAGNAFGSVLSRVTEKTEKVGRRGIGGDRSTVYLEEDYFWVATISGTLAIYGFIGGELKRISDATIEQIINSWVGPGAPSFFLSAFEYAGSRLLIVAMYNTSVNQTLAFDIGKNIWFEWPQNVATTIVGSQKSISWSFLVGFSAILSTGKEFSITNDPSSSANTYQDNGSSFTMTIQTQPYYINNGLPFIIDNITLIADSQSSGSSTLSSTADDYATFGTIGSFDLTQQQKNLPGGGYYDSSVAFKLTDSGNNAWRGQALKITWRPAK